MKQSFHIDIATDGPITPKEKRYKYLPLLGDYYVDLYAYNMETILAEKIETILSRSGLNGRMRDFYDVYLIYTKDWKNINIDNFRKAIDKTFAKREYVGEPLITIDVLRESELIRSRWKIYQRKYEYAKDIDFDDILDCIVKMVEQMDPVVV